MSNKGGPFIDKQTQRSYRVRRDIHGTPEYQLEDDERRRWLNEDQFLREIRPEDVKAVPKGGRSLGSAADVQTKNLTPIPENRRPGYAVGSAITGIGNRAESDQGLRVLRETRYHRDKDGPQITSGTNARVATSTVSVRSSGLLEEYLKIPLEDYDRLSEFIFKNRNNLVSQNIINVLRQTAKASEVSGNQNPILLLHHGELLSNCHGLATKDLKEFLNRLCEDGSNTRKKFIEDVKKAQSANKDEANKPGTSMTATPGSRVVGLSHQQVAAEPSLNYGRQEKDLTEKLSDLALRNEPEVNKGRQGSQPHRQRTNGRRPSDASPPPQKAVEASFIRDASADVLDSRFRLQQHPETFFKRGRVFAVLWHQNAGFGSSGTVVSKYTSCGRYGEPIQSHVLRMVVVKCHHGFCNCLPINTYNGRGLSKPGFSREDRRAHAVIYMSGTTSWLAGNEPDVVKQPIAVDKSSDDQVLDKYSRLNFARIHSVDFNTKVMDVGLVAKNSLPYLDGYYHEHR